ncbi:MAG TPA: serine/threonine-protein kinase [Myxococcales bacterium]|jgi:serine/threonine-protein kinase
MLRPGSQVGKYRLVQQLGQGGMGCVFEAVHVELSKRVALKTLHPQLAGGSEQRDRFLREGRAAARLRHPHVVEVFDAGEDDGVMYLVMELLEGEDLGQLLDRESRLSVERSVDLMLPVLAAVATVHEQGIVHRDLKPGNIFLARDPYGALHPKVLDFGISRLRADSNLTPAGDVLGSPRYMSPEQTVGLAELDARSDQFSLGVILYELLAGELPFAGSDLIEVLQAIREAQAPPLREKVPGLPLEIERAVMRSLAREPDDRFASVFDLGKALVGFAGERGRVLWSPVFAHGDTTVVVPRPRAPAPAPATAGAGALDDDTTRPPARRCAEDTQSQPGPAPAPTRAAPAPETDRLPATGPGSEKTQVVGGVHFLPASEKDAAEQARRIIEGSPRLVLLCAAQGPAPETRPPLLQVLASVAREMEPVVLVEGVGPPSWRNPMEELCAELAPGNSTASQSYLVFERGACVHAVRKDIWNPAADAQRLREFLTGRRRNTRK